MKICIISVSTTALQLIAKTQEECKGKLDIDLFYVGGDFFTESEWNAVFTGIEGKDILLLDLMGAARDFVEELVKRLKKFPGDIVALNSDSQKLRSLVKFGQFTFADMEQKEQKGSRAEMTKMMGKQEKMNQELPFGKMRDRRNYFWLGNYWRFCNPQNIKNLLYLLGREYGKYEDFPVAEPPDIIEEVTIFNPETRKKFKDLDEYIRENPFESEKPNLGLFFSHNNYPVDTYPALGLLIEKMKEIYNIIPLAVTRNMEKDIKKLRNILCSSGWPVDAIVNLLAFRIGQGPMGGNADLAVEFLKELNAPVLHPFFLTRRNVEEWQEDIQGARSGEFLISIFLPELDGCIETYPIGALQNFEKEQFGQLTLIEERVEHLSNRVLKWIELKRKENKNKKVAVIFYDYPPGESNIGSGAFLDSFSSLEAILQKLFEEGYDLKPMTKEQLKKKFIDEGRINSPQWMKRQNDKEYIKVDKELFSVIAEDMPKGDVVEKNWGCFPGEIMQDRDKLIIPGIINGNIFIGIQPSRGYYEETTQNYHDKNLPPHYQYTAFYKWVEKEYGADICVHVGTHGTLEFLPGKELAVSGSCYPDYLVGTLPHLYIYYSGNPAEAMIAKRRTHALMISHLHPPYVRSELYGDMEALELLINEYEEASNMNSVRCSDIMRDIKERVEELGWQWDGLDELSHMLYEMKTSLIPGRLHIFGQSFSEQEIEDFLVQLFQYEENERPSLFQIFSQKEGWKWQDLLDNPHKNSERIKFLEQKARQWIRNHVIEEKSLNVSNKELLASFEKLQSTGKEIKRFIMHNEEFGGLTKGLKGEFIPAGLGGDVFRDIEVLPTGRNIYQFDPRRVPSPSAIRKGWEIAENTIKQFKEVNGKYPNSIAVVLWGLETSKTQGETIGQILAYLGVKLKRVGMQWEPKLEIIPLEQLGRPRIDVKIQICGFLRDMFPNIIEMLNEAFEITARLKEEGESNFVQENAAKIFASLQKRGMDKKEAQEFAAARIFGPEAAQYGTGVNKLVKSRRWQNEGDLVSEYMDSLRYVYTKKHHGIEMKDLLEQNLENVEVVSQIRSSRDYEITDLDHYYEFFGGLAKTVEQASGKKAMMLISDTHNGKTRTETVQKSIQRGSRTRLLNPKWLDSMLDHNYHGGQQLADRMENLVGLAATTGEVDNCLFDEANEKFILDEEMRKKIQENNPFALKDIMERLLEANARGYWETEEEKMEELKKQYLLLEGELEEEGDKNQ